jgi:hypothetical protein
MRSSPLAPRCASQTAQPEQLEYAGRTAQVKDVSFFHGGDEIYTLQGVPGVWHEECLTAI